MALSGVPVIDASQFLSQTKQQQQQAHVSRTIQDHDSAAPPQHVVDQIAHAFSTWGFFQLVNHGVDLAFLDRHYAAAKRFFSLPAHVKQTISRRPDNAMGYFSKEFTKQKLDIKEVFDYRVVAHPELPDEHPENFDPQGCNQWPAVEEEFRQLNKQFAAELTRLSFKLLEAAAMGLGLQPHTLHHLFLPSQSTLIRLNHYPVDAGAPADSFGVSHHKDSGFLTVLLQDEQVPGLQVEHEGEWYLVQPLPGAFTINAGDMLQVLSNDRYIAANHRVLRSSSRGRYSRVLFFNPHPDAVIQPLLAPGALELPHYRPISWKQFYLARLDGNYADLGEEVQIEHYRIRTGAHNADAAGAAASAASAPAIAAAAAGGLATAAGLAGSAS